MTAKLKSSDELSLVALFEFFQESKSYGVFKAIAISSLTSFFKAIKEL